MTSTPPIPNRAKPPAFSAAIFPPFWETHVFHFWFHDWRDSGSQQHTAIHMLSSPLSLTPAAQTPFSLTLQGQNRISAEVLVVTCHLEGLSCLSFRTNWRNTEDNIGKKHALPLTLSPNSLNLAWDLRTSEYFRYSDREKEIPNSDSTHYNKKILYLKNHGIKDTPNNLGGIYSFDLNLAMITCNIGKK